MSQFDASVVGAGPNGLAAALELARNGRRVLVVEAADTIGGGARTEELTLPGFRHDVCSAIHPSGLASTFFRDIALEVEWIQPEIPFTHPLDGGRAAALHRSIETTAEGLGDDARRYRRLMTPLAESFEEVIDIVLRPLTIPPRNLGTFVRVAGLGGLPAALFARSFSTEEGRALIAGLAAHSIAPFGTLGTTGVGVILGLMGHVVGWPLVKGGSDAITHGLSQKFLELGGSIETGRTVTRVEELPGELFMLDVMPPAARSIGATRISGTASRRLRRWQPGPGVFKVDYALSGPVPWADPLSGRAGTVHLGGTYAEVAEAEAAVAAGRHPEKPFVLVAQQSLFDSTRAPGGQHTLWAYCHVPNGSGRDMTEAIERQIERFAPGFRDIVLHRTATGSQDYQSYNPNLVGGDIGGGRFGPLKVLQLGVRRPYDLGGGVFLCSSAAPPGAGVHGMCGFMAARAALA